MLRVPTLLSLSDAKPCALYVNLDDWLPEFNRAGYVIDIEGTGFIRVVSHDGEDGADSIRLGTTPDGTEHIMGVSIRALMSLSSALDEPINEEYIL